MRWAEIIFPLLLCGCGGNGGIETSPEQEPDIPNLGIRIADENRCTPYRQEDYPYPQSVELDIIESLDGIYSPYTGQCFEGRSETDIEHIVARSEAHDSGLCSGTSDTKAAFATDLLNLTLASPELNRYEKSGLDVAEWQPEKNVCWFAQRTIDVRRKYNLTIDQREANTVEEILSGCVSTELVVPACSSL